MEHMYHTNLNQQVIQINLKVHILKQSLVQIRFKKPFSGKQHEKFRKLLFDGNTEKQRISALSLGMIGDSTVVQPLIEAINHPEEEIRRSSIISLARIGDERAIEPIAVALNDESKAVRKSAINSLVILQRQECVPKIKFLLDDEDLCPIHRFL